MLRVFLTHHREDLDAYFGRALPELMALDAVEVVVNTADRDLTTPELIEAAGHCEVIVAHRSAPGAAGLFTASPQLIAFLRTAVDISTIDVEAASEQGVLVAHAAKCFIASTAEHALGLLLALARQVGESTLDYRAGRLPPQRPGRQLSGKTVGLIGFGDIARHLAPILRAIGLHVLVTDPYVDATLDPGLATLDPGLGGGTSAGASGFDLIPLDDLLRRADVVMPLAASTPETVGLIGAAALAAMKPGALLVNVSRGELLDEVAVADALDSGRLGGLAMDVGSAPDQRPNPALATRPGVVATPHLGGLTPENADGQARSAVEQIAAILAGTAPPRAVNADAASRLHAWWSSR